MGSKWVHRLSAVDSTARTATCANCGPVSIKRAGAANWSCGKKIQAESMVRYHRREDARKARIDRLVEVLTLAGMPVEYKKYTKELALLLGMRRLTEAQVAWLTDFVESRTERGPEV